MGSTSQEAEKYLRAMNSNETWVKAEVSVALRKFRKSTNEPASQSSQQGGTSHGTDIHYNRLEKADTVRLEVKASGIAEATATNTPSKAAVNNKILEAENQHKSRLKEDKGNPTWYKTVISLSKENLSCWPFRNETDAQPVFDNLKSSDVTQQRQAEFKIKGTAIQELNRLAGAGTKRYKTQGPTKTKAKPKVAWKDSQSVLSSAATKWHTISQKSGAQSQTPQTLGTQNSLTLQELSKRLIVTERITVENIGGSDYSLVLDRTQENKFKAHWKESNLEKEATGVLRHHWDVEEHKGNTRLHEFAEKGDVDKAMRLIERKQKATNQVKPSGQVIAVNSREDITLNVSPKNIDGNTPLHLAVENNQTEMVELLLKQQRINVSVENVDGNTPLHLAAKANNLELVSVLCEHKDIDLNITNNEDKTPLDITTNAEVQDRLKERMSKEEEKLKDSEETSPSTPRPGQ